MGVIRTIGAVAACKGTRAVLRLIGRGGTALPGKAAMKVDPEILAVTSRDMEIIVVTGTNGKTTTSRMLEHAMTVSGKKCLANKSGANLLSGVTAEFTATASLTGKPGFHYAVVECDEGALKQVVPLIKPKVIVVTNLFRDQLDRYGEVLHTLDAIRQGIEKVPDTAVCLNADCSLTSSLADGIPNKVYYFGMNSPFGEQKEAELSDAPRCIRCGAKYEYSYHTYAHLGGFICPQCGYKRRDPDVAAQKILSMTPQGTRIRLSCGGTEKEIEIALPAVYNVYNALAAVCAYTAAGFPEEEILLSLSDVQSSFGRLETFRFEKTTAQMVLVKNPAGCNEAIRYVTGMKDPFTAVLMLNDRTADGHDISWIWDVDYEAFAACEAAEKILVGGDRAEDLAVRLKYAGVPVRKIRVEHDLKALAGTIESEEKPVFILPNYTSMLALRAELAQAAGKAQFWK